jgi:hypothetical protein
MNISAIYDQMRALDLVTSQVEFSRIWLDRSDRYYSYLVSTHREPSVGTLSSLAFRLERFLPTCSSVDRATRVLELTQLLRHHIHWRSVVDIRRQGRVRAI